MNFAVVDLDGDNTTKPNIAVLAVNHDGTAVGSDYKFHFYSAQGVTGEYKEVKGSSSPLHDVQLCGPATCGKAPPCCTSLAFTGESLERCRHNQARRVGFDCGEPPPVRTTSFVAALLLHCIAWRRF